jgi:hypothetical protein
MNCDTFPLTLTLSPKGRGDGLPLPQGARGRTPSPPRGEGTDSLFPKGRGDGLPLPGGRGLGGGGNTLAQIV